MTPEKEFAHFIAAEAEKRGMSYFVLVSNPETAKFSYTSKIWMEPDQKMTVELDAIIRCTAWIKQCYQQAGALEVEVEET
jgi:hypothetical protein